MFTRILTTIALIAPAVGAGSGATAPVPRGLPPPVIPQPFGVNIHFVKPDEAEVDALAGVGYRFVRMDFWWGGIERRKGEYNFADYDLLVDAMQRRGIRLLFILDYGNRLYVDGLSPYTDEGRAAFARWAAAAARRYAGRGIIWEIWNEPNIGFWKPRPNVDDYCKLAHAVIDAVRAADPQAYIVAPASSGFPWDFFQTMADRGVFHKLDAVSVHPYRQTSPETVLADYHRLRLLLHRAVPGRYVPIISGEWGYSTVWGRMNEQKQAQYIARQWLTNLACDVPLSIWYDWKDDGDNPKDPEHHFGSVYRNLKDKPAAVAARALWRALDGYRHVRRLHADSPDDYLLLFVSPRGNPAMAAWTTAARHNVAIPHGYEVARAVRWDGQDEPSLVDRAARMLTLDNWPAYIHLAGPLAADLAWWGPRESMPVMRAGEAAGLDILLVSWQAAPAGGRFGVEIDGKPLAGAERRLAGAPTGPGISIPLRIGGRGRQSIPAVIRFHRDDGAADAWQSATIHVLVSNTLAATILPPAGGLVTALIDNPSGEPVRGVVRLLAASGRTVASPLELPAGRKDAVVTLGLPAAPEGVEMRLEAADEAGAALFSAGPIRWLTLLREDSAAPACRTEGDAKVSGSVSARMVAVPAGLPQPGLARGLRIDYRFGAGWRYALVSPPAGLGALDGRPLRLGMWVHGDGSSNHLRCRFIDSTGQVFQPSCGQINWKGWRWVAMPLTGQEAGHWGGANDGVVHHPIRLDTLVVIDSAKMKTDEELTIHVAGCAVGY